VQPIWPIGRAPATRGVAGEADFIYLRYAMDWFAPLDQYCERLDASFWAEPYNALTNAAFFAAALGLHPRWRRDARGDLIGFLLIANIFIVGVGSFLFHTFANRLTELADIVPIVVFILFYLAVALRTFVGLGRWQTLAAVAGFLVLAAVVGLALNPLLGLTASYLPALAALFVVGLLARPRDRAAARGLMIAGCVFTLSVVCRAADMPLCSLWPHGTHLGWHLLNAVTLYIVVRLYLATIARPAAR
jgi:hypothetical protein